MLISMVAAGLACGPALPPPPAYPTAEDGLDAPEIETPPGLSKDSPPPQAILPGDVVRLRIMSAESYEPVELWVDDLGRIHVPFGGDVEVLGLGLTDAESRIEQVVRQYDRYARVSLAMHSFSGHRVTVTGAVDKPGVYEARPGLRIADIVASAGGTRVLIAGAEATEAADMEGARIVRDGKTLPVSVKHALFGESQHNVFVRPGDIIYVPWMASRQIPVLGDVRSARNVPFHEGLRLTEALAAAGGPSRTADTADIRIVRGPLSRAKVYRANLDDVMKGDTTDVVLAPGDVVFVTEHWFATTTDVINRLTPILATAAVFSTLSR
ncbi:MAG: SLBB domain-containing protein [Polyangiaceae bacterium]|nr:SLBB domain-containing protein [Polyangiaceae bacterium]